MNNMRLCFLLTILTFAYTAQCTGQSIPSTQNRPSDSAFLYNYKILDSISINSILDTSKSCKEAVLLMEKYTSIMATKLDTYFGKILFTRNDLMKWKYWHDKSKY